MKRNGKNQGIVNRMVRGEEPFDVAKVNTAFADWEDAAKKLRAAVRVAAAGWRRTRARCRRSGRPRPTSTPRSPRLARPWPTTRTRRRRSTSSRSSYPNVSKACNDCHEALSPAAAARTRRSSVDRFRSESIADAVATIATALCCRDRRRRPPRPLQESIACAVSSLLFVILAMIGAGVFWVVTAPATIAPTRLPAHTADLANGKTMFYAGGCAACHATPDQEDTHPARRRLRDEVALSAASIRPTSRPIRRTASAAGARPISSPRCGRARRRTAGTTSRRFPTRPISA